MKRQETIARAGRPAQIISASDTNQASPPPQPRTSRRVIMVDLNNFATFPTLAIGILVAALRNDGKQVEVICPLAHDVPAAERERREHLLDHLQRRAHLSTWSLFRWLRDWARHVHSWWRERPHKTVLREVRRTLDSQPDVVLLSAYLQHLETVRRIAAMAEARNVPVLLGGPMFNVAGTAAIWRALPGITAVVGAEADQTISAMVDTICDGGDLLEFPGVILPDGRRSPPAPPLRQLDRSPMADFTDFPWDRYRVRIIPMMTGRGCQWNRCVFCSDVVSANGRTFRTRSVENVLLEMQEQARRHNTTNFLLLDLKLNSFPDMIRGIAAQLRSYVPGAEWVGTVHVDLRADNGLSSRDLRLAVAGGMRRISFGMESGSQRLLDHMDKGSSVEANSAFIRHAHEAGLSVRCTMFKGFPGETAKDMEATAAFLEAHGQYLGRVRFNEFSLLEDTPIYQAMVEKNGAYPQLEIVRHQHSRARAQYRDHATTDRAYRKAKARALRAVYAINRRPLRPAARQFDGLM